MNSYFIVILFVSVFAVNISSINAKGEPFLIGTIGATDVLLTKETIKKRFSFGRTIEEDRIYTPPGTRIVTAIRVRDNKFRKGATAAVVSGSLGVAGPITLRLTSQRNFGIDSTVEVYATV